MVDFSLKSAFWVPYDNNPISKKELSKIRQLALCSAHVVWLGLHTHPTAVHSTDSGTVEHSSNYIIKFADDTVVVRVISNNSESVHRAEVQQLVYWCQDNNLSLTVEKTKERVVDLRRGTVLLSLDN